MLLEIQNLKKTLNRSPILKGVSFKVEQGERLVIIGRSGGGKSVLLRHVMGLLQPDEGKVLYQGVNLSALSEEELNPYRRKIGMLFQNGALFDSMSVEDNLAFPLLEEGGFTDAEIKAKVHESLEMVDLPGQQKKMPAELSGGMKKRVALARAVINRPELMLYDEPTTGLDPIVADSINRLILRLSERLGMASIVVTHDMVSAYLIADRICYLHQGQIYFEGTAAQVQSSEDPLVKNFVQGISVESDAVV
jgi:phospholipid/cholesterol/gamma-HCH transport system ATP-binding protein